MRTAFYDNVDAVNWGAVMPQIEVLAEQVRETKKEIKSSTLAIDRAAFALGARQLRRRLLEKSMQAAAEDNTQYECCIQDEFGATLCLRAPSRRALEEQLAEMRVRHPRWFGPRTQIGKIRKKSVCHCRGSACACGV